MKVIVEVNLNEIWPGWESQEYGEQSAGTLGKQVEEAIAEEVKSKIWNLVRDSVNKRIIESVYDIVQKQVSSKIDAYTEAFLETGTFVKGNSAPMPVKEYVESFISDNKFWQSFASNLDKTAANYANEVQKQYDAIYATKIVMALKENDMLDKEKLALLFNSRMELSKP